MANFQSFIQLKKNNNNKKIHWLHFQISKGLMSRRKTKSRALFFSKGSKYSTFHLITQQHWSGDAYIQLYSPIENIVANTIDRTTKVLILPFGITEPKWWTHNQLQTSPIRKRKRWLTKKIKREKKVSQLCRFIKVATFTGIPLSSLTIRVTLSLHAWIPNPVFN